MEIAICIYKYIQGWNLQVCKMKEYLISLSGKDSSSFSMVQRHSTIQQHRVLNKWQETKEEALSHQHCENHVSKCSPTFVKYVFLFFNPQKHIWFANLLATLVSQLQTQTILCNVDRGAHRDINLAVLSLRCSNEEGNMRQDSVS